MARPLSTYTAKRDFARTREPGGESAASPSERLRYVIQKHDATRLHYDFRLEHEGVFLSWAVTRGPSRDPHDKRLAVQVEDHPLAYGDFEGTIPKGQYGGGTVMLWDRGFWAPEPGVDIDTALKRGELKFVLEGERLHGGWVLVRLKPDRRAPKRDNWLLIKHHDAETVEGDAEGWLETTAVSIASGRDMAAIAGGRKPGPTPFMLAPASGGRASAKAVWTTRTAGPAEATPAPKTADKPAARKASNAKAPKLRATAPAFVEPALAKLVERPPAGDLWIHEIKFDGYRLQLRIEAGRARLRTRKGLDWTDRFPEIAEAASALPDAIIDGEAVALDAHGSPDFAGLQLALSEARTVELVFFAFDLLFAEGEDLRGQPLAERKTRLKQELRANPSPRIRYVEHFAAGGEAVLKSACSLELEGVVSKRLDAPYRSGRGGDWVKSKCRGGQEVVIAGWTSDGPHTLRSLIAGVQRDGRLVHVGRIGTGFSRDKAAALLPRLEGVETDRAPFTGKDQPRGGANIHWAKPVLVAEIESAGWTGSGALRQASFKGLREDKPAEEVVREAPPAAPPAKVRESRATKAVARADKAAATRAAPIAKATSPVVMGVRLSHPEKPLWPAQDGAPAVSKLDLARYFEAIGPSMMAHIRGRPCSIVRTPDGVGGQSFFQRHAGPGASALIDQVQVRGDKKPYLQIDRVEALAALAQAGAVELHPWNCAPDRPEVPGRLVFDLDPGPEVDFATVIAAAREVRERLEAVGLAGFCKTTGGKGLHVVAPLTPDTGVDWPAAKAFAKALCDAMAADAPQSYLTVMAKARRVGRIFLDYLCNDRLSTAVAPYSPRARPGATVSMPLTWAQVKRGLDPKAYTVLTAPALVRRSKAWQGYDDAARPLRPAIDRLSKG